LHRATHFEKDANSLSFKKTTDGAVQTDAEHQQKIARSAYNKTACKLFTTSR
jgi:hypothetical protein